MKLVLDLKTIASAKQQPAPIYLPLGARYEFRWVDIDEIVTSSQRKYLFNFIAALSTSSDRLSLKSTLDNMDQIADGNEESVLPSRGFIHVIEEWAQDPTNENNPYLSTEEYRTIVLESAFTLCPSGHNPESFRIFEALEAGSIPIIARNDVYKGHACRNSLRPLLDSGAPIVVLNDWSELPEYLLEVHSNTAMVAQMQTRALLWYHDYFRRVASDFESVMDWMRVRTEL